MTDYELLEMAAKAVNYDIYGFINGKCIVNFDTGIRGEWNPINDDGAAFRLAIDLDIDIMNTYKSSVMVIYDYQYSTSDESFKNAQFREMCEYSEGIGRYAATRLAIVKAAADIGKNLA